jgi:hypothetical protein
LIQLFNKHVVEDLAQNLKFSECFEFLLFECASFTSGSKVLDQLCLVHEFLVLELIVPRSVKFFEDDGGLRLNHAILYKYLLRLVCD